MAAKIIFVGNYKGGVGKTTSVLNFGEYFAKIGKKVLVLDIDPQSSLSEILVSNGGFGSLKDLFEEETLNYIFDLSISKIERYPCLELKYETTVSYTDLCSIAGSACDMHIKESLTVG